jgi:hypothetical protein
MLRGVYPEQSRRAAQKQNPRRVGCSRQPVIPGEHSETRNPGRETWFPAGACPEPFDFATLRTGLPKGGNDGPEDACCLCFLA